MEKQKKWQLWLISLVLLVTLYNILPTLFWYSKPLKSEIDQKEAQQVATHISERVNGLQQESIDWLSSFTDHLGVHASSIQQNPKTDRIIDVDFKSQKDAERFAKFITAAGNLIPFVPAQLRTSENPLAAISTQDGLYRVAVQRNLSFKLDPNEEGLFLFSKKIEEDGQISPFYKKLIYGRLEELMESLAGKSAAGASVLSITENPTDSALDDLVLQVASEIKSWNKLGLKTPLGQRLAASLTQFDGKNKADTLKELQARMASLQESLAKQEKEGKAKLSKAEADGDLVNLDEQSALELLTGQIATLKEAKEILSNNQSLFAKGKDPLTPAQAEVLLEESEKELKKTDYVQMIRIAGYNPFIEKVAVDWSDDIVTLIPYQDVTDLKSARSTEVQAIAAEQVNRALFNSMARVGRFADETVQPKGDHFTIQLNSLTNSKSLLALDLGFVANKEAEKLATLLKTEWQPSDADLSAKNFPIRSYSDYLAESKKEQRLGLVILAPSALKEAPEGFNNSSIYIIAKGLNPIIEKWRDQPEAEGSKRLVQDLESLKNLLASQGFISYPAKTFKFAPEFDDDFIFEERGYYDDLLAATRENFVVKGSKKYATLEFTDVEQRILTRNKIEDKVQEDLVKWQEEYNAASVDQNPVKRLLIPPPSESPYLANFALTARKYFRGDERKILRWGLDLSGGKTVRIGLRDEAGKAVTNPDDLNQAVNELYTRINKMGVSERTIRIEGENVILDFPGSQAFSANELIKASAMYFHIVNEKFGPFNKELAAQSNEFLQEVWNEAVVTNRTDPESINEIAWRHLGGDPENPGVITPKSELAQTLYKNGLRLANPYKVERTGMFDDTLSMVAKQRGDSPSDWRGAYNPLMFTFNNYALEGSSLTDIRASYDPSRGNMLLFAVKSSYDKKKGEFYSSPQQDLYAWTSQFAEDRIAGTPKENYSRGGWRMAVILNGEVVSYPALGEALSSNASIHGNFTPREINELVADLKAGSLSFTPKILSEQNVSPELGKEERGRGILASVVAILLVVGLMVTVYRFAGVVASIAVIINLLIMWGVLQSIGAALTLPGIAGLVLTIGMAVDANVLVFERVREEFAISGRIASALQAGYRKAFSAIVDSNLTTLMVAIILLQFDSGPIKSFAVMIIIGILSSMFTGLFMTRYFFAGWAQRKSSKGLTMMKLFNKTNFDFLKYTKPAVVITILIIGFGTAFLITERNTIFGMDFTGGYSLTLDLEENPDENLRLAASDALAKAGAKTGDVEIRELSRPNQLRIQLGMSMEESGHPFHGMAVEVPGDHLYPYENNPRITWVVDSLKAEGLNVSNLSLLSLDKNWSAMSGQLSDTMRNNALLALGVAMLGVLIYITFRFEFKYAVGALFGLIHDVWITLGIVALLHLLGVPVELNLQAVGALMTIIGYSLNDTIIVFDRIREEIGLHRKLSIEEVVNLSLNATLNRTVMTSGTTLLVLFSLVFLGGASLFSFSLIMAIGVLIGTFSSLYIASPVMLFVHYREKARLKTSKP